MKSARIAHKELLVRLFGDGGVLWLGMVALLVVLVVVPGGWVVQLGRLLLGRRTSRAFELGFGLLLGGCGGGLAGGLQSHARALVQ